MYKSDQSCRNVFYPTTIHQQRIIRLNSVKLVAVYAGESDQKRVASNGLTGVTDSKSGA